MTRSTLKDHPRLCGEKYQRHFQHLPRLGSPPPMRGKAFDPSLIILNKRITPAYAGKREFRRVQTLLHQDHPRLCGEKVIPPPELPPVPGSPPPMRGKVPHSFVHHLSTRITPAYAGKSLPKSWRNMTQKGSPPPMRGKEYRRYLRRNERGITPAYAGKSPLFQNVRQCIEDHPRLCGEKTKKIPKQRYFFHQPASFSFSLQYT